jgi:hypothetical protein
MYASTDSTSSNQSVYGLSKELTVAGTSVSEIDPAGMGSVFALVAWALGLLERRRLKTFSPADDRSTRERGGRVPSGPAPLEAFSE